jgi:predicted FMN-binding regulatory protein PaiB
MEAAPEDEDDTSDYAVSWQKGAVLPAKQAQETSERRRKLRAEVAQMNAQRRLDQEKSVQDRQLLIDMLQAVRAEHLESDVQTRKGPNKAKRLRRRVRRDPTAADPLPIGWTIGELR